MKLFQINVTCNWGSTGRIAEAIGNMAIEDGWESYIACGRLLNNSQSKVIQVGTKLDAFIHYAYDKLFDMEGRSSKKATRQLVQQIKSIKPDIVQLHNIHDHYLNYQILFEYLNQTDIKVVWTFHDFWAMTGGCYHFVSKNCSKFEIQCSKCPLLSHKKLPLIKQTKRNFDLKKKIFLGNPNLIIIAVSEWVGRNVKKSFLKCKKKYVITNGVDTSIFKPTKGFSHHAINDNSFIILGVSSQWKSSSKGLNDYLAISKMLGLDEYIVLVGVTDDIINKLPENIIGIKRTNNQEELAALYTRADVVCSLSTAETFGMTIVEGYACGTPAVVYDNTALPDLITPKTGLVVPNKDFVKAYQAIQTIKCNGKKHYEEACIQLVERKYNKDLCFRKYIKLYNEIIRESNETFC